MRKQFFIILLALLAVFGLMVSCKNEVSEAGFGEELVSVSFGEYASRGLSATLEGFEKDDYYWAYAAQKADGSNLISGQTKDYGKTSEVQIWVKTDGNNKPVAGLGSTGTGGYERYKVPGFSQGYWNFKLYAYKRVNTGTTESPVYEYNLVYQGETKNALLKSDSTNEQGSHLVNVIVDPVQSTDNGTMVFLTNKAYAEDKRISMNTVNSATYGQHYTVEVLSILSMEEIPVEYVGTAAEKKTATDSQDGEYSLPAGSYKVTVAFTEKTEGTPTVNYARGTIVATVYSNLTTTISGDLTEAMTYAEFDGILNPDLETVTASKDDIVIVDTTQITEVILKTDTSAAKEVTATIKTTDTNSIINNMAEAAGTSTGGYDQTLELTLSVETVETTATTATYEIGMTAELTSSKTGVEPVVTTSDVSEVDDYVIVEVQLETGLTQVNVLHDGKQMIPGLESEDPDKVGTFAYNAVSGILTIKTMSFSPFEVSFVKPAETSYVAQVGKVKYQSLAAAISAAKTDGTDTITLLNDVSLTSETDISKKVVLDLAGYTIAAEAGLEASVAETTIKNGSIVGALIVSGSNIGLSAVAVTGSVAVSGSAAFDADCSVTGTGEYAINVTGSITIDGGTYTAAKDECILSGKAIISDGNFNGSLAPTEATGIVLKGGTYTEMQADSRLAQGCECVEISDGVYMVRNIVEAVNVRTGVKYHYLQNAIDAASAGDTVKLLRSITSSSTIRVDAKNITLDLDGKTITAHATPVILNLGGKLTINGTGATIDGYTEKSNGGVIRSVNDETQTATLVINGGTYNSMLENGGSVIYSDGNLTINGGTYNGASRSGSGYPSYSINNYGTMTITDAVITSIHGSIATNGSNGNSTLNNVTATLSPTGIATGLTSHVIYTYGGGSVVINSGTYWNNASDATSTGGDVVCNNNETKSDDTAITINGGLFKGGCGLSEYWNGDILVKGGEFDKNPSAYVVPGYEAIYHESTKLWTVEKILAVSIVRGTEEIYYGNFEEAYAEVESGDKMVVLRDCTASYHGDKAYDFSGKNVTIHVNEGATLACGDVTNGKFEIGWNNAPGTLTLEGQGRITFDSNNNWGLITQNGGGNNIKAIVRDVTIEASSANGYVMTSGNLTVESGNFKKIAFDNSTVVTGGYFTTDVSDCIIPEGKMCGLNPDYPSYSSYQYYITDLDPEHANFSLLHEENYSYFSTLAGVNDAAVSGDTVKFIGSDSIVHVDGGINKFNVVGGVTYDLNNHTIEAASGAYAFYMGMGSKTITMKNGTINATNKLCEDNSIYTFTVLATDLTINDAIRESALSHINNGVYVYENSEYFTVKDEFSESYRAKLTRDSDVYFFTYDGSVAKALGMLVNGDALEIFEGCASEVATSLPLNASVTITRSSGEIAFPIITASGGVVKVEESGNVATYSVNPRPVARVGSTEYTDLQEAVNVAKGTQNSTVTLLSDVTLDSQISVSLTNNRKWSFDFNGHSITTSSAFTSSSVFYISGGSSGNTDNNVITFKNSGATGGIYTEKNANALRVNSSWCTLKIQGGEYKSKAQNESNINGACTVYIKSNKVSIEGGTFENSATVNKSYAIAFDNSSVNEVRVSGGVFLSNDTSSFSQQTYGGVYFGVNASKIYLTGGVFRADGFESTAYSNAVGPLLGQSQNTGYQKGSEVICTFGGNDYYKIVKK